MGKIFYLMGKSAVGKDTLYKRLLSDCPELGTVVLYTTRPMREGEQEGREYHFTDEAELADFAAAGKVIESRTYETVAGPWTYATVDDGSMDREENLLMIGTLESYLALRTYFGSDRSGAVPEEGAEAGASPLCGGLQTVSRRRRRFLRGEPGRGGNCPQIPQREP